MFDSSENVYKKILGRAGERQAVKYLKKQGYTVLKTNYVTPFGEADIVVLDKKTGDTVFVEVKTRTDDRFSTPAEAVDGKKQKRYRAIAKFYMASKEEELYIRFDVIEVEGGKLNHIVGAF